jgi:hypothetical protein
MIYLLAVFIALQIVDGVTTYLVLTNGGYEKNPIVAWGMAKVGMVPALVLFKGLSVALGVILYNFADQGGVYGLAVLTAIGLWVAQNNYRAYKSLT